MSHPESALLAPAAAPPTRDDVGGDFELVSPHLLRDDATAPPWEVGDEPIAYVQSGRQALALSARAAWDGGHRHLLAPAYLCDSMLQPFVAQGMTVAAVAVDDHLHMRPDELAAALAATRRPVILHAGYFGQPTPPGLDAALDAASSSGALVVTDETHRLLVQPAPLRGLRIASLRKLLPVADGGYVAGAPVRLGSRRSTTPDVTSMRLDAMRAKSTYLTRADADPQRHLRLYAASEELLERRHHPEPMSAPSSALLEHLDYGAMASARASNASTLMAALAPRIAAAVINPPGAGTVVPSHLVLGTGSRQLQKALAAERIYCPVHWPPSRILTGAEPWPSHLLSVPVDQRYGEADMLRVATAINRLTP